jgi:hypothetical protein
MADFNKANAPIMGKVIPILNEDLGLVLQATAQGAGTLSSSTLRGREKNYSSRGARATMVISGKSGTIDVVLRLRRYDKASGTFINLLSSASQTADGTTTITVHPELTAAANSIAKDFIGEEFDIQVANGAGSTPAWTGTVGVELLA